MSAGGEALGDWSASGACTINNQVARPPTAKLSSNFAMRNNTSSPLYIKYMSSARPSRQHFDVDQKCAAVRRVLGGESANRVAAELQVSTDRLARWERQFLKGGRAEIAQRHGGSRWMDISLRKMLPWAGLLLLLIVTVYAASRFLQAPAP